MGAFRNAYPAMSANDGYLQKMKLTIEKSRSIEAPFLYCYR